METNFEYNGYQVRLSPEDGYKAWIDGKRAFLPRYTTSAKKAAAMAKELIDRAPANQDPARRYF